MTREFVFVAVAASIVAAGCGGGGTDANPIGPPASVAAVSGSNSTVTAGSAAPIPLVAKVLDQGGHGVPNATVTWATASGSISPPGGTTDGSGQTTAQWTPGKTAGAQSATASVTGAGAATFTATVAPGPVAKIKLSPDTIRLSGPGSTAQLTVVALDAFDNTTTPGTVIFSVEDTTVATVSLTGLVTSVKTGTTRVQATSGAATASSAVVDPCAGVTISLAVGASRTLTGPAASQFCVAGAAGAEFVAIPFFATGTSAGANGETPPELPLSITPMGNSPAVGPPSPDRLSPLRARASVSLGAGPVRDEAWEYRLRERVRKEFGPLIQTARRAHKKTITTTARNSLGISPDVSVGELLQLNTNVNSGCDKPTLVAAKIQAVSTHAIVAEDTSDASGPDGFTSADYQFFADKFDSQVWPVDSANFGAPTDIDMNGRIILFFTKAVNALTPKSPTSTPFIAGFFYGRDEFYKADTLGQGGPCKGSNQGELFYLLAPDPQGSSSNAHSVAFVRSITIGTVAHEFQHLINFGRHLWINETPYSNFEETFLDEGLAHVAEELNYYAATHQKPRTNINATTLTSQLDSYLAFGNQNAVRFREYLKNPDRYPPYSVLADTSLSVRGGIWSFLRYAADQQPSPDPESKTWFALVNPVSDVQGIENLKVVFGSDVLSKMRNWAIANYLDDFPATLSVGAYQHPSWNIRSVESYVNDGTDASYPLKVNPLVSLPISSPLADGGAAYFRFGVAADRVGGGVVSSTSPLPSSFSLTVIRTK